MTTIADIQKEYFGKLDHLDLDLILAHVLKKSREFVMIHPEFSVTSNQQLVISKKISRRMKDEPLAYILGHKEFYGLDFKVTPDTLIPRPETELMVELALQELSIVNCKLSTVIDIGTGSGNIIISLANSLFNYRLPITDYRLLAIDISKKALAVARQNAKIHKVDKKIKFLEGSLLDPILKKSTHYSLLTTNLIILANLPYLSKEIYSATLPNVKKYEPKSALFSPKEGLDHYEKLLQQLAHFLQVTSYKLPVTLFLEISPEQKSKLPKIIKVHLPQAKIEFLKDLARKWRICKITV